MGSVSSVATVSLEIFPAPVLGRKQIAIASSCICAILDAFPGWSIKNGA